MSLPIPQTSFKLIESDNLLEDYKKAQYFLRYHRYLYYTENPIIPDAVYDRVDRDVLLLEQRHPELVTEYSISQTVGIHPSVNEENLDEYCQKGYIKGNSYE